MKAAVLRSFERPLEIEDIALADPRDREVLVRIRATGVCASDLSTIRGKTGSELPLVPGHEMVARRPAAGSGTGRAASARRRRRSNTIPASPRLPNWP